MFSLVDIFGGFAAWNQRLDSVTEPETEMDTNRSGPTSWTEPHSWLYSTQ
jgi:hypothetical protein